MRYRSKTIDRWVAPAIISVIVAIISTSFNSISQASPAVEVHLVQQGDVYRYRKNIFQRIDKYSLSYIRLNIANRGTEAESDLVVTATLPDGANIVGIKGFTHFQIRKDFVWREIGDSFVRIFDNKQTIEVRLDRLPPKIQVSVVIYFAIEYRGNASSPQPVVLVYGDNGPASITN